MRMIVILTVYVWMSSATVCQDFKAKHVLSEHVLKDVILTEHALNLETVFVTEGLKEKHAPRHLERRSSAQGNAVEREDVIRLRVFANVTSDSEISTAAREYARLIRSTELNAAERENATQIRRVNVRADTRVSTVPLPFVSQTA